MFTGCIVKLKSFKIKMLQRMAKLHIFTYLNSVSYRPEDVLR